MVNIAQKLADFVYQINPSSLSDSCIEQAKKCFLDLIGVAILGSKHVVINNLVNKYVYEYFPVNQSSIIGNEKKTSVPIAAFINSTMGHILDYDDIKANIGHPGVTVVPAILSLGEFLGSSGKEVLCACVLGIEISSKIANWLEPEQSINGWQATCTSGIFGVTAAAGKLIGLDNKGLCSAFGIAASFVSGLKRNSGTFTKAVQAGKTAEKGISAALLAKTGITSDSAIFNGKNNIFNILTRDKNYLNEVYHNNTLNLSEPFEIMNVGFKIYPSCASTHTAIEAVFSLQKKEPIQIKNIQNIRVGTVPININNLRFNFPKDPIEAKFSMQFCLAVALLKGKLLHQHFTQKVVENSEVQDLMKKISLYHHPDLVSLGYRGTENAIVEIEFKDSSKRISRVDIPKGHPRNPISTPELIEKYENCAKDILTEKKKIRSIDILLALEREESLGRLMSLITGKL